MAAAETGTGKTGAFCLPLLQIVYESLRDPLKGISISAGAPLHPRQCAMSSTDRDPNFAVSADGLVCQVREAAWQGGRANVGVFRGKYYFEATVSDEGLCRVGWSTRVGKLDLGTDACGFGYGGIVIEFENCFLFEIGKKKRNGKEELQQKV
jgi:ATP-dependent RNA helicase DDX1